MGLQNIKSYFKLVDTSELTPEQRFKSKGPQYFWPGSESEANSRRTTPAVTPAGSRRNSAVKAYKTEGKSDSQIAFELWK